MTSTEYEAEGQTDLDMTLVLGLVLCLQRAVLDTSATGLPTYQFLQQRSRPTEDVVTVGFQLQLWHGGAQTMMK